MKYYLLLFFGIILTSCIYDDPAPDEPFYTEVYAPVYATEEVAYTISIQESFPIVNPGKIWLYNDFLMVNKPGLGVHVLDNSNPNIPNQLFFISIPGNQDIAIKDGFIYADNLGDIVAFTFDENQNINIEARLEGIMQNNLYPPFTNVAFECVDPNKGIVIDWVVADIENPKCFRR